MASFEPSPLDFGSSSVKERCPNDNFFLDSPENSSKLVGDQVQKDQCNELVRNVSQVCVRYRPPLGFTTVDHASPITSLDFHVEAPLDDKNECEIFISVSDPKKVGESVSAYITYKVSTKTWLPTFMERGMVVYRRFSDFYTLYEKLLEKHSEEGRFVPLPPKKNILSMAKVKITKDDASSDFIERRRKLLENFLRKIASHPYLKNDPNFVDFLEAEGSPFQTKSKRILGGGSFLKLFQKVEESFNKATYKMEEIDKWFERKEVYLTNMEEYLQSTCGYLENLLFHKKEFSQSLLVLSKSLGCISSFEQDVGLSRILCQLLKTLEDLTNCHDEHLEDGCGLLLDFVKECLGSILSAKETMITRMKFHKIWVDNEVMLAKKREVKVRMELAHRTDKIAEANRDIAEWELHVERGKEDFNKISHNIKDEMKRFEALLLKDFKEALLHFLESMLFLQQMMIKEWDTFINKVHSTV